MKMRRRSSGAQSRGRSGLKLGKIQSAQVGSIDPALTLISRVPGAARSIQLLIPPEVLPILQ